VARTPRSVRTARDNARARAAGYANYYQWRIHQYGAIPASEPVTGAGLRAGRGHATVSDFLREIKDGSLVVVGDLERGRAGRYTRVVITVVDLEGRERHYTIRGKALTAETLHRIADGAVAAGATVAPTKSLNLFALAAELEPEAGVDFDVDVAGDTF
jgi:hypothetical protein